MKKNSGLIHWIKRGVDFVIQTFIRLIAAFPFSRRALNSIYVKLSSHQRSLFNQEFAKIFKNNRIRGSSGTWNVVFLNKSILMPLTSQRFWLDWDLAVSIVGHDIEVVETYEALIGSSERPELFIDIGANYGIHSLLFLVHQIKTISFEPNTSCHAYFTELCELNKVTPGLEPVALGDKEDYVGLSYPVRDTWLGSTNPEVTKRIALSQELVTEKVEQKILDDYFPQIGHKNTLMKIDTEGNELSVLLGATRIMQENRPRIIFESFKDSQRMELFNFFNSKDYIICNLPWDPSKEIIPLLSEQFMISPECNFIAVSK